MTVGTTVTIDGNSTGLVDSLEKAKTAVTEVKDQTVKLSKQFKDVADDADKAAGAFVQSLGGGAAIKAIGGVGVAMGAVKMALDAVVGSADTLFSTMGEEGARASEELSRKMAEFGSVLVKIVTGSTDFETVQRRLNMILDAAIAIVNAVITPIVFLLDLYWRLIDDTDDLTDATTKLNEAKKQNIVTTQQQIKADLSAEEKMQAAIVLSLQALGEKEAAQRVLNQQTAASLNQTREINKELYARNAAARYLKTIEEWTANHTARTVQDNIKIQNRQNDAAQIYNDIMGEREDGLKYLEPYERAALEMTRRGTEAFANNQVADQQRTTAAQTNSHSRTQAISDEEAAKRREAEETERKRKETEERRQREEQERQRTAIDMAKSLAERLVQTAKDTAEAVTETNKKAADEEKSIRQMNFDAVVGQNAKMLAIAIVNKKKASDIARAIVGNTVSAYGDAAMVKAGIEAADGNWVQAGQLTAAGFAAYLVAASLGADQQKKATTPPTERAAPVQNYSYSLRVDAAFADGEAVSRHFARMQDGARQRGLIGA